MGKDHGGGGMWACLNPQAADIGLHLCRVPVVRLGTARELSRSWRTGPMRGRNRISFFRYRSNYEPMVPEQVVKGIRDFLHRHERRRAGLLNRFWLQDAIQSAV